MSFNLFSRKKTVKERGVARSTSSNLTAGSRSPTDAKGRSGERLPAGSGGSNDGSREKLPGVVPADQLPALDVINKHFEDILSQMALPADKLEQMRNMSSERKWTLVTQHKQKVFTIDAAPSTTKGDPASFVELVQATTSSPDLARSFQSLEVSLRTQPIQWVRDFAEAGGLDALLNQLERLCHRSSSPTSPSPANPNFDRECQHYCVRAIRAALNNTFGLSATIDHPRGIPVLALALTSAFTLRIRTTAIEVLAAVCFVPPKGHDMILRALEATAIEASRGGRFQILVDGMAGVDFGDQGDDEALCLEYQISCMAFINAIVNSPDELTFRIALREEFMGLKLHTLLAVSFISATS
ncbi:Protein diaphanous 1 [Irineochytrium annulatum]|nr:Protein diaphanous 1 [Irineochytrium annulatum]